MSQNLQVIKIDDRIIKNAKEFRPKKIQNEQNKKEEKKIIQYVEADNDEDDESDIDEKIERIEKEIIEAEAIKELDCDISEDEDKWVPKYRDCECCKGFVFNCNGEICADLGQCFCKMKDECDKKLDGK